MKTTLQVPAIADLAPHTSEGEIAAIGVGPDNVVCALICSRATEYRSPAPGYAPMPVFKPDRPAEYRVILEPDSTSPQTIGIREDIWGAHLVQPIGDTVIVGCRAYADDDVYSGLSFRLYDRRGSLQCSLNFGCDTEDIQVDSEGTIWVSHGDQTVAAGEEPAVAAWTQDGRRVFAFEPVRDLKEPADCYALNVASSSDVWFYYYDAFSLVHLRNRRVRRYWDMPVSGSKAFAIEGDHALFAGGYDAPNMYHVFGLVPDHPPQELGVLQLTDRKGLPIHADRVVGRGDSLFLLCGAEMYRLGVNEARHPENADGPSSPRG